MHYILFSLLLLSSVAFAQGRPDTITNGKVIKMAKSGLSDVLIKRSITAAKFHNLDLSSDAIIEFKNNKVSDDIVLALFEKSNDADNKPVQMSSSSARNASTKNGNEVNVEGKQIEFGSLKPGIYMTSSHGAKPVRLFGIRSSMQIGTKVSFINSAKWFYEFAGTSAQIKINTSKPEFFLVAGSSNNTEFEPTRFVVINVEPKKGKRRIDLDNGVLGMKSLAGPSSFSERDGMITPIFTEYTDNVYKITFNKKFPVGNYLFAPAQIVREQSMEFFEFDIVN